MSACKVLAAAIALAFVTSVVTEADAAPRKRAQVGKKRDVPIKNPFGDLPNGPLQMVVSIENQHVTLYANGVRVAQSKVSTGTASNPTPTGVFSVIEKDRWHRSNLYDNAPMFYMQRLTWSGVAMHEGILPGYPASHGCIRMPTDFASRLWPVTRLGVRVIVARNDPVPFEFEHPKLFHSKPKPVANQVSDMQPQQGLRSAVAADGSEWRERRMAFAQATVNDGTSGTPSSSDQPAQVVKAGPETAPEAAPAAPEAAAAAPKPAAAVEPANVAPETAPATVQPSASIEAPPPAPPAPVEVEITVVAPALPAPASTPSATEAPAVDAIPVMADGPPEPEKREPVGAEPSKPTPPRTRAAEPTKRAGQVAVFVSKQEKKIFVRQGFVPVFEMPVEIADPGQPLGTHVFTAMEVGSGRVRWNAISMPPERPGAASRKPGKKSTPPPPPSPAEMKAPSTAVQALDRIKLPPEAVERISELLTPGSSLVVSDHGLGRETGRFTEFIVVTRQ